MKDKKKEPAEKQKDKPADDRPKPYASDMKARIGTRQTGRVSKH